MYHNTYILKKMICHNYINCIVYIITYSKYRLIPFNSSKLSMSNIQDNSIDWPESSEDNFISISSFFSSEFQGTTDETDSQSITVLPELFYVVI